MSYICINKKIINPMNINLIQVFEKTIIRDDYGNVFIEPLCDFFGIQRRHQLDKIRGDKICQSDMQKSINFSAFGDNRPRICLGKKGFIRWIQLLTPAILRPELQVLFEQYQVAVFDYLYEGSEKKTAQLEDIRDYTININHALRIKQQLIEYITEQKQHRDICLSNSPDEWAAIKPALIPQKILPAGAEKLKALTAALPDSLDELRRMKKNVQTNMVKARNMLDYQSHHKKEEENPMPQGYKREVINTRIREYKTQLEEIDAKMAELIK